MTNTNQLTGAVAFLASIAALDNFIFVELEPGFESMVLVETDGLPGETETAQTSDSIGQAAATGNFWIDQHRVKSADFSKFLENTGHEPQEVALNSTRIISNKNGELAVLAADEKWRTQISHANWEGASDELSVSLIHVFEGQDGLKVSYRDAQAYCNWLGKQLPTANQVKYVVSEEQDPKTMGLLEFRCAKNI